MTTEATTPEQWAIIELMGHLRIAGRLSEEEKFGTKLGRVDVPTTTKCTCQNANREMELSPTVPCDACNGSGVVPTFVTQYFGSGSVYRITIVSETVARHTAKSVYPAPVAPWDFPKQPAALAAPAQDRTLTCGHTPEDCDCDPDDEDYQNDDDDFG